MFKFASVSTLFLSASLALAQDPGQPGGFPGIPGFPPATAPATQPTTQPALLTEARAGLVSCIAQVHSGDVESFKSAIQATSESQKKAISNLAALNASAVALFKATQAKYGQEALDKQGLSLAQFPVAFPPLDATQYYDVKLDGAITKLIATPESGYPDLDLVKEGATYKLHSSLIPGGDDENPDAAIAQEKIFNAIAKELAGTTEDVNAGKIRSADEVLVLLNYRMQKTAGEVRRQVQQEMMEKAISDEMKRRAESAASTTQPAGPPVPPPAPVTPDAVPVPSK